MDRYAVFPLLERIACCLLAVLLLCSLTYLDLVSRDAPQYSFFISHLLTLLFKFSLPLTAFLAINPTRGAEVRRYTQAKLLRLQPSLPLQPVDTRALQSDLVAPSAPLNLWIETTTPTPRDLHCLT